MSPCYLDVILNALGLLGNTAVQTSKLKRKRFLRYCNQNIQDLKDKDKLFTHAPHKPFKGHFEKKMKVRDEASEVTQQKSNIPEWKKTVF